MTLEKLQEVLRSRGGTILVGAKDGPCILIAPALGARVMGASVSGLRGENLLWVHPDLGSPAFWLDSAKSWNVGGHRTWVSPEDALYLDRKGNWFVPAAMDPGRYWKTEKEERSVAFGNECKLQSRDGAEYNILLRRAISLSEPPPSLPGDVRSVAFRVSHALANRSEETIGKGVPHIGLWSLLQVEPPGSVIIPLAPGKSRPYRDYFDPVPADRIQVSDHAIVFKIDGRKRGKIGVAPSRAAGGIAYISEASGREARLFVSTFDVDAGGLYLDHPWGKPRGEGDAVESYNDDGAMAGFAEMECHSAARDLKKGEAVAHDVNFTILAGDKLTLTQVGSRILGIDLTKLMLF